MSKNSIIQIENDRRQLLLELIKNGRESINKLAEKSGYSRQKVWRLIKMMEKDSTIWGSTMIVDSKTFDLERHVILIKWKKLPMDIDFLDILKGNKLDTETIIEMSCLINGNFDWLFIIQIKDMTELKKFCDHICKTFEGFISKIITLEVCLPVRVSSIDNPSTDNIYEFYGF